VLVKAGHCALRHVARFDERILAHQDGCVVAGSYGKRILEQQLDTPDPGRLFALAGVALAAHDEPALHRCLAIVDGLPEMLSALFSAFGWSSPTSLGGLVGPMLGGDNLFHRQVGLAACRLHGRDPGKILATALQDPRHELRCEALRTTAAIGRHEFAALCSAASTDEAADVQLWGAWSAVLLGNRGAALATLGDLGLAVPDGRIPAFALALQAMRLFDGHAVLQSLARDPKDLRGLVRGSGIVGDPTYVPWLIGHSSSNQVARLAGEAFTLITGADLSSLDLERRPPEDFESGPNDDPDDPNVDMDPDDGLPWPDPERIKDWWSKNSHRFQPGTRYFMGAPVTREHCIDVLKNGYQRQRILAAHYLCLLEPGTPLFNTSAPAWRQQRLLAQMQ
jgi:uncharacterized protein (TIGR02270 family)